MEITGKVPEQYLRYKDPEPDKKAIGEWLKDHDEEWAHLEDNISLIVR